MNKHFVHLLVIVVVGIIVYSNTLQAPFQWDESVLIVKNTLVRDLANFREPSLAKGHMAYNGLIGRYVGFLTFALDYKIHGLNVTGYHIVNISIHIINSVLVYLFIVLTFRTPFMSSSSLSRNSGLIAFFSALLFVSHPVQTEAVTYIFQRLASLVTLFYLLTIIFYIKFRLKQSVISIQPKGEPTPAPLPRGDVGIAPDLEQVPSWEGRKGWVTSRNVKLRFTEVIQLLRITNAFSLPATAFFLTSLVSCILAMKTKENAFTLPVMMTLYEFSFFEGPVKKRLMRLSPLLLTMLIIPVTLIGFDRPVSDLAGDLAAATRGDVTISRYDYLLTQFSVITTYIRLLFFPVNQNLDYDYPVYSSFFTPAVFTPFIFLLAVFGFGVYAFRRSGVSDAAVRLTGFGIFWFFLALSVESSIVPIPMIICEYRVYLPSVGMFLSIITSLFMLMGKVRHNSLRICILALPILILPALAYSAYARNSVWKTEAALWEDVVIKSPMKARGHHNLGNVYITYGQTDSAIEQLELALKLKPDYADAYYSLGNVYKSKAMAEKAIYYYENALKIRPDFAEAYNDMGFMYKSLGSTELAVKYFKIASSLRPDLDDPHFNMGALYIESGLPDKARVELETALRLNPRSSQARQFLEYLTSSRTASGLRGP